MITGQTVHGETSLEITNIGTNHQESDISYGGSRDHVFEVISVSWDINNSEFSVLGLEPLDFSMNGDTTITLGTFTLLVIGVLVGI